MKQKLESQPLAESTEVAVPGYQADLQDALTMIGQKEQYIGQLRREMLRRALRENEMHDELIELRKQIATLRSATEAQKT